MNQILSIGQDPEENGKKEKKLNDKNKNSTQNNYNNINQENNYMSEPILPMDNNYMGETTEQINNSYINEPILPMDNNYMSKPTLPTNNNYIQEQSLPIEESYDQKETYGTNTNYSYSGQSNVKADISKVIKIFCISIILFGIVLIGNGTYAIIKSKNNQKDTPNVNIEKMGREATITINTQKPIREYNYRWNEGEKTTEKGNGSISVEKTVQIPNGNNILRIEVIDYYGNKTKHFKQYIYESTDINKPVIELAAVGTKLKITATDDIEISYITYKWDEEESVRIDVSSEDKKTIEKEIEVPEGNHKLTITAVDKEENREIRTESVIGDTKPTFNLSTDGENIIIVANDDQGISKISVTIDGQTTDSGDEPINQTNVTAKMPITRGTHEITVTVTNINGLTETQSVTHTF